jgi:hypothetical protein
MIKQIPTDNKETLWIETEGYYISIGLQFHRKAIELLSKMKGTFPLRDLSVNIQASCRLYKFESN